MSGLFDVLTDNFDQFASGFWVTVRLVGFSFAIALVVGTAVAHAVLGLAHRADRAVEKAATFAGIKLGEYFGQENRLMKPPIGVIPATTTTTFARCTSSRRPRSLCNPATPTSQIRVTTFPITSAVTAASAS